MSVERATRRIDLRDRVRSMADALAFLIRDRTTFFYFSFLMAVLALALVGPVIAPYGPEETVMQDGEYLLTAGPSPAHPLGTTSNGYDVLSRLLVGARPTAITGLLGGSILISIGLTVGVTSGYVGGRVDDVLMRTTDLFYGLPVLPVAMLFVAIFGITYITSVVVIGLLLWTTSARVIRSQVLQIRERPFITAAKATGASTPRIIVKHILPNVAPMAIMFFALGIGFSILIQAGLAFLGITSPFVPTWGVMIRNAYGSGQMSIAWWWSIPPGVMLSMTVLSTIMFGRRYEELSMGSETDEAMGM